jgi:CHAT domain-containing protein
MPEHDELRLLLSLDHDPQKWAVQILHCPEDYYLNQMATFSPAFTRPHLVRMRNRRWPDAQALREVGTSVWGSLLPPRVAAVLERCLHQAREKKGGLRLVVITALSPGASAAGVERPSPAELPVEALYHKRHGHLATLPQVTVSRGVYHLADPAPLKVPPPLRVLAVVATPEDKPRASAENEVTALRNALGDLAQPGGRVRLTICRQPTRDVLQKQLKEDTPHVLHFIGHGRVDVVDEDPTPRAYIYLLREGSNRSHPVDADTLAVMLQSTSVRLVVLTACSTAQPAPDGQSHNAGAFNGVAQGLLDREGDDGPAAVVAMQFDLEETAAVVFTGSFYRNLFAPDRPLDEVVSLARQDLVTRFDLGHRAWVTPAVYSRRIGGRVFELLGETLELRGDMGRPGHLVSCWLMLGLRTAARIDLVSLKIDYPAERLAFEGASPGSASAHTIPLTGSAHGRPLEVAIVNPSKGQRWQPGEYQLGRLTFRIEAATPPGRLSLKAKETVVWCDGAPDNRFWPVDGTLSVESSEPPAPAALVPRVNEPETPFLLAARGLDRPTAHLEFRISVSRSPGTGTWVVKVLDCPDPTYREWHQEIRPVLTAEQIGRLHSRAARPNTRELQDLGRSVWKSLLPPVPELALKDCLARSRAEDLFLRVVVVPLGQELRGGGGGVSPFEVPVEALYHEDWGFLGLDHRTSVSRGLMAEPGGPARTVALPLRVLLVAAAPNSLLQAGLEEEVRAVREALAGLTGPGGPVVLDRCTEATRAGLQRRLEEQPYDVLHYIGHGGFQVLGDGQAPRPCLFLTDESGRADALDADTLSWIVQDTSILLVVFTAGASAAPTPTADPDPLGALYGVARRLLAGPGGAYAAIAAQFDLAAAPPLFAREFYRNLLAPDRTLDEAVTLARRALFADGSVGQSAAWVAPAAYLRCADGKVFEVGSGSATRSLADPAAGQPVSPLSGSPV